MKRYRIKDGVFWEITPRDQLLEMQYVFWDIVEALEITRYMARFEGRPMTLEARGDRGWGEVAYIMPSGAYGPAVTADGKRLAVTAA